MIWWERISFVLLFVLVKCGALLPRWTVFQRIVTTRSSSRLPFQEASALLAPTHDDMKHLSFVLANMTDHLDTSPEIALSIASQEMGWLFQRDVPKLTELMLKELPALREDQGMMRSYMFLLDFLEAMSRETSMRVKSHQNLMKELLEAAKRSETTLNDFIESKAEQLTSPEFKLYLQSEVEAADKDSPVKQILITTQLRLLDEEGKRLGIDVMMLPKLAAEKDPTELRRKTLLHLSGYDAVGKQLFLQTLSIMLGEMKKRYQKVDPLFILNLEEVQKIVQGCVLQDEVTSTPQ